MQPHARIHTHTHGGRFNTFAYKLPLSVYIAQAAGPLVAAQLQIVILEATFVNLNVQHWTTGQLLNAIRDAESN